MSAIKCINLVLHPPPREEHQEQSADGGESLQLHCSWRRHFQGSSSEVRGWRPLPKVRLVLLVPLEQLPRSSSICMAG